MPRIDSGVMCTCEPMSSAASTGVITTPSTLEMDAELTARATFPRATEVNAMDDCTVEGRMHKKRKPVARAGLSTDVGARVMSSPSSGKTMNVLPSTRSWNRHWANPAAV